MTDPRGRNSGTQTESRARSTGIPADENSSAPAATSSAQTARAGRNEEADDAPATFCGMTRGDQLIAALLAIGMIVVLSVRWFQAGYVERSDVRIVHSEIGPGYRINLNTATWVELSQLDGIGPTMAQRIVADRETNGPFKDIDDITRVKGIGPILLERNREWLRVDRTNE